MRCLWLTLADPDPPHNGQYVYSAGLISAFAAAGAALVVVGLKRPDSRREDGAQEGAVVWRLAGSGPQPRWRCLTASLPHMTERCNTAEMQSLVREELARGEVQAIVFDSLTSAWALDAVLDHFDPAARPKIVYVSHNHEASLRLALAAEQARWAKQLVHRLDAAKVAWLERRMIAAADLVTAITPEDACRYRADWPGKRVEVLTPGYAGRALAARRIAPATPRRAIIVGSFEWVAKKINLEEFVRVADPIFAAGGAELQVIGSGERALFDRLEKDAVATRFMGTVERVEDYMAGARVAIVPERNGGGFKLKVLDYIFNRMPIAALDGSIAGTPLRDRESVLFFSDQVSLAAGVIDAMDDVERLNSLQETAFKVCRDGFDWRSRGRNLAAWIGAS
ncbi:MAG TPA: glycosyltransferase [Stellaceae bacterium]|nr:glycosyltransferase [Stellaceae bacterium]